MSESYNIFNIKQVVEIGTVLSKSWFRGHSKVVDELVPKVFRNTFTDLNYCGFSEFSLIEEFKRIAPSIEKNLPQYDNNMEWLFLMQHHGTPTRLLDWSESILIALFFAVSENPKEDGELWALFPKTLNVLSGIPGLPTSKSKILEYLFAEPQFNDTTFLLEKLELKQNPKLPIAFSPPIKFARMNFQQSVFTIHPKITSDNDLKMLLPEKKNLVKYIIPKECKHKLLYDLNSLGIKYHTLFPDLDNLSKYITKTYCSIVAYSPPEPPNFVNE